MKEPVIKRVIWNYAKDLEAINDDYVDALCYAIRELHNNKKPKNYKERFIKEYKELKERYNKLHNIIIKAEANTLDFELSCPLDLLKEQANYMGNYLHILEIRAEIEGVDING